MTGPGAAAAAPSAWVTRWLPLLVPAGGRVLDLACGSGRHLPWLAAGGWQASGVDRDAAALQALRAAWPASAGAAPELVTADLEQGPWPLAGRRFDAVVVTNYLWRPRVPQWLDLLGPGGVLLVETFAAGQERIGRPRRPEFLLRPGELLDLARGLRVVAYEDGFEPASGGGRFVQRIAAVRAAPEAPAPRLAPGAAPGAAQGPGTAGAAGSAGGGHAGGG